MSPAESATVKSTILNLSQRFKMSEIPEADLSARYLTARVLGETSLGGLDKHTNEKLTVKQLEDLETLTLCRLARMPIQYIVGDWEFRNLTLKMKPPVFIPRPETEQLVDLVLPHLKNGSRILEIGCGSGPICLSLLKEGPPDITVVAVDRSKAACALTIENAVHNGLTPPKVVQDNITLEDGLKELSNLSFDLMVSNPPYVFRKDVMALEPEINLYEDLRALDAGKEGLDVILPIMKFASRNLKDGGHLLLEVDPCHPYLLPEHIAKDPSIRLEVIATYEDFNKKDRFMQFQKKPV